MASALRAIVRFVYADCPAEIAADILGEIDVAAIPAYVPQLALRMAQDCIDRGHDVLTVDAIRDTADEAAILYVEGALATDQVHDRAEALILLDRELRMRRVSDERAAEGEARSAMFLMFDAGDKGNADCIVTMAGGDYRYTSTLGWLRWTGTHWSGKSAEADFHNTAVDVLQARYDASTGKDYENVHKESKPTTRRVRDAEWQARWRLTEDIDDLAGGENLLNCANGIVNLESGKIAPFDRERLFTYCVSTPYQRGATSKLWLDLLFDWFDGNEEMIDFVQTAIGYSLTGSAREECAFYLQGPGRSGKGTLINTVASIIGSPLARSASFDAFTAGTNDPQNFRLAPLWNARMITASENMRYKHFDESTIKTITGRDQIQVAFKGKDSFNYTPQFKLWLGNNWPIRGDASDAAFWARFHVIPFRKSYIGAENKGLKDELASRYNRVGILAWAIEGAQKWYAHGLNPPAASRAALEADRLQADYVYSWALDNLRKVDSMAAEVDLNEVYQLYTEDAGDKLQKSEFSRRLNGYGYATKRVGRGADRRQVLTYCEWAC